MDETRKIKLLDEIDLVSKATMNVKNASYATSSDVLHNFKAGAEIMGGTQGQACWGYLTKHLVALRDKIERNDFSNREDLLEKCQDAINYIKFIWLIGNEEVDSISTTISATETSGTLTISDIAGFMNGVGSPCNIVSYKELTNAFKNKEDTNNE